MRIAYNILADIKKGIPENAIYRILTEEKIKYIMNIVDKEEDIQRLEKLLGNTPIEIFIRNLARQFDVIENMRRLKPWEHAETSEVNQQFAENFRMAEQPKYPQYRRSERTKQVLF